MPGDAAQPRPRPRITGWGGTAGELGGAGGPSRALTLVFRHFFGLRGDLGSHQGRCGGERTELRNPGGPQRWNMGNRKGCGWVRKVTGSPEAAVTVPRAVVMACCTTLPSMWQPWELENPVLLALGAARAVTSPPALPGFCPVSQETGRGISQLPALCAHTHRRTHTHTQTPPHPHTRVHMPHHSLHTHASCPSPRPLPLPGCSWPRRWQHGLVLSVWRVGPGCRPCPLSSRPLKAGVCQHSRPSSWFWAWGRRRHQPVSHTTGEGDWELVWPHPQPTCTFRPEPPPSETQVSGGRNSNFGMKRGGNGASGVPKHSMLPNTGPDDAPESWHSTGRERHRTTIMTRS